MSNCSKISIISKEGEKSMSEFLELPSGIIVQKPSHMQLGINYDEQKVPQMEKPVLVPSCDEISLFSSYEVAEEVIKGMFSVQGASDSCVLKLNWVKNCMNSHLLLKLLSELHVRVIHDDKRGNDIPNTNTSFAAAAATFEDAFGHTYNPLLCPFDSTPYDCQMANAMVSILDGILKYGVKGYQFFVTVLTSFKIDRTLNGKNPVLAIAEVYQQVSELYPEHLRQRIGLVCSVADLELFEGNLKLMKMPKLTPGISMDGKNYADQKRVGSLEGVRELLGGSLLGNDSWGPVFPVVGRALFGKGTNNENRAAILEKLISLL